MSGGSPYSHRPFHTGSMDHSIASDSELIPNRFRQRERKRGFLKKGDRMNRILRIYRISFQTPQALWQVDGFLEILFILEILLILSCSSDMLYLCGCGAKQ